MYNFGDTPVGDPVDIAGGDLGPAENTGAGDDPGIGDPELFRQGVINTADEMLECLLEVR